MKLLRNKATFGLLNKRTGKMYLLQFYRGYFLSVIGVMVGIVILFFMVGYSFTLDTQI
ncbi:MAG: hypothetical protein ACLUEC_10365 [Coprococcus sp.]